MKVIKKINNNVAICLDNNNKELIVFGKGVGFPATPYILDDLTKIERIFYGVDHQYINQINHIPEKIINISAMIIDEASLTIKGSLNPNIVFTLADHIDFAIQRLKKNIQIFAPYDYDIKYLYPKEYELGIKAVKYINKTLKVNLGSNEAASIAIHLINEAMDNTILDNDYQNFSELLDNMTNMIQKELNVLIDKDSMNFSRFTSHMMYFFQRSKSDTLFSNNTNMLQTLKKDYPHDYACVCHLSEYLEQRLDKKISEEEMSYLMVHVIRLCSREKTK